MSIKNPLVIGGAVAFLIIAGIAWNYTETIKAKNETEKQRIVSEERIRDESILRKRAEDQARIMEQIIDENKNSLIEEEKEKEEERQKFYIDCIAKAQGEYDARAAEGPIFGTGPRELMESKKRDCERLYGIK